MPASSPLSLNPSLKLVCGLLPIATYLQLLHCDGGTGSLIKVIFRINPALNHDDDPKLPAVPAEATIARDATNGVGTKESVTTNKTADARTGEVDYSSESDGCLDYMLQV